LKRADGYTVLRLQQQSDNKDVLAFQQKFDIPMASAPAFLDSKATQFRVDFMQEELDEFKEAVNAQDLAKAADALVDLAYVVHGTALMMGLPWEQLWAEVQRANMAKVRATDLSQSKRQSTLDVVKPPGWLAPCHQATLLAAGMVISPNYFDTTTRTIK
jgi:predicted HAD superfamily Cof-like phosphohydrolase